MKTAISIPDPLYRAADRLARKMHVSRSRLYATAVAGYLKDHEGEDVTRRLNGVYGEGAGDSTLPAEIAAAQSASLSGQDW
jgi:hypothetical protein